MIFVSQSMDACGSDKRCLSDRRIVLYITRIEDVAN